MATINDVFNQLQAANGTLTQIDADVTAGTNATNQVKASVDTLDADVKSGLAAAVNVLQTIAQIDVEAVKLMFHLTQQADTMICALEHISRDTCGILSEVTLQTQFQARLSGDAEALREIAESAYPATALDRSRLAALRAEIERCCPPAKPEPACVYEACERPRPVKMPDLPRTSPLHDAEAARPVDQ